MIKELITAHSSDIDKQIENFLLDYPMGSYIPAWKIFRAFSRENYIISGHIGQTTSWNLNKNQTIVDVGTGDGLVLKLLTNNDDIKRNIIAIEPNQGLLSEAEKNLGEIRDLRLLNNKLFSLDFNQIFKGNEVILLVHVLYLLEENSISELIDRIPKNTPIIIVTDAMNSLFTDCWSISAPKFANRSKLIHSEIEKLQSSNKISVSESSFKTLLKNPFSIDREDIREALLSMITYSEFSSLSVNDKIDIKTILDNYSLEDLVECESVCYEVNTL